MQMIRVNIMTYDNYNILVKGIKKAKYHFVYNKLPK